MARGAGSKFWSAPKLTAADNTVFFYVEAPVSAIVAVGKALTSARATDTKWYEAKIGAGSEPSNRRPLTSTLHLCRFASLNIPDLTRATRYIAKMCNGRKYEARVRASLYPGNRFAMSPLLTSGHIKPRGVRGLARSCLTTSPQPRRRDRAFDPASPCRPASKRKPPAGGLVFDDVVGCYVRPRRQ
jgi:hypothetical protein